MKKLSLIFCLTICSSILFAQETERSQKVKTKSNHAKDRGININNNMPNRISMNVTVGKQTITVNLTDGGANALFPDKTGLKINSAERTITEMTSAEYRISTTQTVPKQTQGTSFGDRVNAGLQQGGSIVSAAISSVSNLAAGGGGAAAAAYAKSQKPTKLPDDEIDITITELLPDGDYELSFVIVHTSEKGLKDTLKTQVRLSFTMENNILKTKHDTAKNSISNIR